MAQDQRSPIDAIPAGQGPAEVRLARSRERWKRLGTAIASITPSDLAHLLLVLVGLAAIAWLIWTTWFSLLPFQIGLVLAYTMLPAVNVLDRAMPRAVAVALVLLAGLGVIVLFFALLVPAVAAEAAATALRLPSAEQVRSALLQATSNLQGLPPAVRAFVSDALDKQYQTAVENLPAYLSGLLLALAASLLGLFNVVSFLLGFVVLPTWLMSVLGDRESAVRAIRRTLPPWLAGDFWAVLRILDRAFGVILRGRIWRAVVFTAFTWIGLATLERLGLGPFPYKLLGALWLGLFSLIPSIGLIIGTIPLLIVGLLRSPQTALIFLLLIIAVQQLESRLVSSRIEARVIDIHPAILVPALVAASQLGAFWVFVAAPLLVVIRDLFRYVYGRVSDPPAPAGLLPSGESVFEAEARREQARGALRLARPSGGAAPTPTGTARPSTSAQPGTRS